MASRTPEQRSEAARKRMANMTPEQRSEIARKGNASRTPEQRSEAARKKNSVKFQCTETGFITNAGNLTRYQRARGIDTSNRIRIS
jgi:ribosomal protein L44E